MSNYRKVRNETAEKMADPTPADAADELLPCRYCGEPTRRKTMTNLGARCQPCYDQFLRLGYSGSGPPKQHGQAALMREAAAKVREHIAAKGAPTNAFGALAERLKAATPQPIRGLSDDEVNAMLDEVRQ